MRFGAAVALATLLTIVTGCAPRGESDGPSFALAGAPGVLTVTRFLTPATFDKLGGTPSNDFDVYGNGKVVLASGDEVYVLRADDEGVHVTPLVHLSAVRSVAVDGGVALLLLTDTAIDTYYDSAVHPLLELPDSGAVAHIAAAVDQQRLYAFGSSSPDAAFARRIAQIDPDGTVHDRIESDDPITAVTGMNGVLYFSTSDAIYQWHDETLRLIIRLPANLPIRSIAVDDGVLYFATADEVYALKGLTAVSIARQLGGTVRSYNGSLYVLDVPRKTLVRIDGVNRL